MLVFPDFKLVDGVKTTKEDAEKLWRSSLDPKVGRAGEILEGEGEGSGFRSRPIPYDSVILICEFFPNGLTRSFR